MLVKCNNNSYLDPTGEQQPHLFESFGRCRTFFAFIETRHHRDEPDRNKPREPEGIHVGRGHRFVRERVDLFGQHRSRRHADRAED